MKEYEREVFQDFEKYANVVETWPLYDSIVICQNLIGAEANVQGWFTTFLAFSGRETHQFFKNRTAGTAGEQYTNHQNSDTMDFAYKIHSFGCEFSCTPTYDAQVADVDGLGQAPGTMDAIIPQYWRVDLARNCGVQLKVQQDVRYEAPCMAAPPGYGSFGGGLGFTYPAILPTGHGDRPWMGSQATQGIPILSNRIPFPEPIGVPRTGSLEVILHVGEWAREILRNITGPHVMIMNSVDGADPPLWAYSRYIVRVSLFGERLVQQRAQYHR